jgi:hypothetical protein
MPPVRLTQPAALFQIKAAPYCASSVASNLGIDSHSSDLVDNIVRAKRLGYRVSASEHWINLPRNPSRFRKNLGVNFASFHPALTSNQQVFSHYDSKQN